MSAGVSIFHTDRLDLVFMPKAWSFADARRADIDAHFAALQRERPTLWNGRILLMHEHSVAGGVFGGAFLETDYASFRAWHDWGTPAVGVSDCFGAAAIIAADGAVLLGVMAPHTANAGRIYFPAGTPDLSDVADGKIDLDFSMARELLEETGLAVAQLRAEPGWTTVVDMPLIVHIKVLRSGEGADALRARILNHLARERQPELSGIRLVRGLDDLDPMMPAFVTGFLTHFWC
jgi:8-oxo-dGTP pyrophosphatase MutT (NUDIX family)